MSTVTVPGNLLAYVYSQDPKYKLDAIIQTSDFELILKKYPVIVKDFDIISIIATKKSEEKKEEVVEKKKLKKKTEDDEVKEEKKKKTKDDEEVTEKKKLKKKTEDDEEVTEKKKLKKKTEDDEPKKVSLGEKTKRSKKSKNDSDDEKEVKYCTFFISPNGCDRGDTCPFKHVPIGKIKCKFNPCTKEKCPYKH